MISTRDLPPLPALVVGAVHHTRHQPIERSFDHGHYQWLMDLSQAAVSHEAPLPRWLGPLGRFHPADHLAGAASLDELIANVHRILDRADIAHHDVERIILLAHARVLGHAFDPMSAFFCFAADGSLRAVVIEVHNTYGERHAYPVRLDERGTATADKGFYVSPFNDLTGHYQIGVRLSPRALAVRVALHDANDAPLLTAAVHGRLDPVTPRKALRTALRLPLMTYRVSALIRRHGIAVWLRRLPVMPRKVSNQESVQ